MVAAALSAGCSVADLGLAGDGTELGAGTGTATQPTLASDVINGPIATGAIGAPATGAPATEGDGLNLVTGEPGTENGGPGIVAAGLSTDPAVAYRPGSCHRSPAAGGAPDEVPCRQPHTIEVYAVATLAGAAGAPFPGLDAAVALCDERFRADHGFGLGLATIVERSVLRPSEASWLAGERDVTCSVTYPAPTELTLAEIDPLRAFDRVSLYGLEAGDCLLDFEQTSTRFGLVDCAQPHDAEIFASTTLDDGPFPGEPEIDRIAGEACFGAPFTEFVGIAHESSTISSLASRPTAETWDHGHRTIACILTDSLVRTGSFAGTGA